MSAALQHALSTTGQHAAESGGPADPLGPRTIGSTSSLHAASAGALPSVMTSSAPNQFVAVVIIGCVPQSSVGQAELGYAPTHADNAALSGSDSPVLAYPTPRRAKEPLTAYLLRLQKEQREQERPDWVLSPDIWARLIGRSERELRRAMKAGALAWCEKACGRDHAARVIELGALITYAATVAKVWAGEWEGEAEEPDWWESVQPKVAA